MSTLLEQVEAMLQGVIDARVREASEALSADFVRDRDALNSQIRAWQASEAKAIKQRDQALCARDTAREERNMYQSQRDAARAELAARVTELEARLAAMTPATVEVDGFRVGDLVRSVRVSAVGAASNSHWRAITGFSMAQRSDAAASRRALYDVAVPDGVPTHEPARKPVEVGDTVRIANSDSPARYSVASLEPDDGGQLWARCHEGVLLRARVLVAVAP